MNGKIQFDGHDWRIKDLSLSRAFGDLDASPFVTHEPEIYKYKLSSKDKFMVLACDGLWDVLSNQEVVNFVLECCNYGYNSIWVNRSNHTFDNLDYSPIKELKDLKGLLEII